MLLCFVSRIFFIFANAGTDITVQSWSSMAAARASRSHSLQITGSPRASPISGASPRPPPSPPRWTRRPARCRPSGAWSPTGPWIGRRAAGDRDRSRIPPCKSRLCGRTSWSSARSLAWSKRLSTRSYLQEALYLYLYIRIIIVIEVMIM